MSASLTIHVAVGVISNTQGQVLIAQRPNHVHQGGLWEFPGGKVEADESVQDALRRELKEELGTQIIASRPLIRIHHTYPDKQILLDVWRIRDYHGAVQGLEGQAIKWIVPQALDHYRFPAANAPIVQAIKLPQCYLITGDFSDENDFMTKLESSLKTGIRLVQLRAKKLEKAEYLKLAAQAVALCQRYGAKLLLNAGPDLIKRLDVAGVHLTSQRLMDCKQRPIATDKVLAASVHSAAQLRHAENIEVDFVVAAPVLETASHPQAAPLGWEGLRSLTEMAHCPVFALGGMTTAHIQYAQQQGAQGIAAISALWGKGH